MAGLGGGNMPPGCSWPGGPRMSLQELEMGMQLVSSHLSQRYVGRGCPDATTLLLLLRHHKKPHN